MQHLLNHFEELEAWCAEAGVPNYRAEQIRSWIAQRRAKSFDEMTNLPKELRQQLAEKFDVFISSETKRSQSPDGTEKLLVKLSDNQHIECVLLRDGSRRTICVSSQVGCAMGCVFCASGLDGVERNLTSGEIIEQMLRLQHCLPDDERLSHIVMMGMGEPLANLNEVLKALAFASSPDGLGISPRRITISTVGLPPAIDRLAKLDSRYNLAVSLHAPNDSLRNRLVPVNHNIGIASVLAAADRYFKQSGRRLTFEYVLLAGVNDSEQHARELASLLALRSILLNVIPYNPVDGLPYETPSPGSISRFRKVLEAAGIEIKFRQRKGDKIDAACGQLRRSQSNLTQLEGKTQQ